MRYIIVVGENEKHQPHNNIEINSNWREYKMSVWNFLKEMDQLQSQLGELSRFGVRHGLPRTCFLPGVSARHFPMINIASDDQKIVIEALAPGLDTDSLKVQALNNRVTISGEKAKVNVDLEKFHRNERSTGKFSRTIELTTQIDPEKVTAEYSKGILTVTLPKAEKAKAHNVAISVK
ncbi:MAG: Hsp20/alpha crystallin family protein [Candidatus Riflebacteria bacterium]|nr:Hsp20/alpha crystallin family protein [Candidatus Riflebacteria bacterium]